MKTCIKCKSEFDGRYCKVCDRERKKLNKIKNPEKIKKQRSEFYQRNKEKVKSKVSEYVKLNIEKIKAKQHEYYLKNKEKIIMYSASRYSPVKKENRKHTAPGEPCIKCGGIERNKYNQCKACIKINHSRYAALNPEIIRICAHNYRAKKRNNGGKLSKGLAIKLFKLQQGKCAICCNPLDKYHMDHIMPIALGGVNSDNNIQLLCPKCNRQKWDIHPIDFMQSKGYLL